MPVAIIFSRVEKITLQLLYLEEDVAKVVCVPRFNVVFQNVSVLNRY